MPRVYNIKDINIPNGAVYCGRGTKYGNPYRMKSEADRDMVCDRFIKEILPTLDVSELAGKDLVCHCKPKRCHCDAILKKANLNTPYNKGVFGYETVDVSGGGC